MARIAFIQNLSFEYLGVMSLSSLLKSQGHEVDVFIEHGQGLGRLSDEVARFNPHLLGFPCTTGMHLWSLRSAEFLKKALPMALTIFGGPHPTFFPEVIEEGPVDIVCRGEGEGALSDLAAAIDAGKDHSRIENLWVKKEGEIVKNDVRALIEDLDRFPFPDRTLYVKRYPFLNKSQKVFIIGRGCPFSCAYCFNHALKKLYEGQGSFVRFRSTDNVLQEIKNVKAAGGLKTVYIQDDTFGLQKTRALEFLGRYREEIAIPFICLLRADVTDEELVRKLKSAGCRSAFFGVETGSQELRNLVLEKKLTDEQITRTASLLKQYKIRFRTYNMFGLPGETLEEAFKTVTMNIEMKTDYPWSSLFQPFPGTRLGELSRERHLLESDSAGFAPSFFKKSAMKLKEKKEIENLHRLFFYAVRFPFLWPVIRKAIRLSLEPFYDLLFLTGYFFSYKQSENLSFYEAVRIGIRNAGSFFYNRGRTNER